MESLNNQNKNTRTTELFSEFYCYSGAFTVYPKDKCLETAFLLTFKSQQSVGPQSPAVLGLTKQVTLRLKRGKLNINCTNSLSEGNRFYFLVGLKESICFHFL